MDVNLLLATIESSALSFLSFCIHNLAFGTFASVGDERYLKNNKMNKSFIPEAANSRDGNCRRREVAGPALLEIGRPA